MTLGNHQLHSCCRKSLMTIRFSFHSASAALRPLQEGGSVHRERWPWPTTQLCGIHRALLFWGHNPEVWRDVSLGLESQGDRGPCVLFFFFFSLSGHTTWHVKSVPRPGIELLHPAVKAQSLNHWTTSEVLPRALEYIHLCVCLWEALWSMDPRESLPPPQAYRKYCALTSISGPTLSQISFCVNEDTWGLPWWSVVKTSSNAGVWVWSLVGEEDPTCLMAKKTKTWNRSNIAANSAKTLKMVHIKKTFRWRDLFISHN